MTKFLTYLFTLITIFSCSSYDLDNTTEGYKSFPMGSPDIQELEGKVTGPENFFLDPGNIYLVADTLLFVTDKKLEKLIHILNAKDLSVVSSFGRIGEGPNEMDQVAYFTSLDNDSGYIDILEPRRRRFTSYSIDSVLNDSGDYSPAFITSPPEVGSPLGMFKIDDDRYVINSRFPCARLLTWDVTEDKLNCSPNLIELGFLADDGNKGLMHYEVMAVRPDNQYIVSAMYQYNRVDVYNNELEHQFTIAGEQRKDPYSFCETIGNKTNCDWSRIEKFGTKAIYASSKYIYVSRLRPLKRNPETLFDHEVVLSVFDWSGNSISRLALGRFIYSFTVDEKNKKLFAIDPQEVNEMIVEYDIPNF